MDLKKIQGFLKTAKNLKIIETDNIETLINDYVIQKIIFKITESEIKYNSFCIIQQNKAKTSTDDALFIKSANKDKEVFSVFSLYDTGKSKKGMELLDKGLKAVSFFVSDLPTSEDINNFILNLLSFQGFLWVDKKNDKLILMLTTQGKDFDFKNFVNDKIKKHLHND